MLSRGMFFFAAFVGIATLLFSAKFSNKPDQQILPRYTRTGRNNTVLFMTNDDYGLSNVHLATMNAMLINHEELELHFASFPRWEKNVKVIVDRAKKETGRDVSVRFHALPGAGFNAAIGRYVNGENAMSGSGLASTRFWSVLMEFCNMPWEVEEYLAIYNATLDLVHQTDPALVIFSTNLAPSTHAVRDLGWRHAILSPNYLKEAAGPAQPKGEILWQIPAIGSGYEFPVPWYLIPANIFLMLHIVYQLNFSPRYAAAKTALMALGMSPPVRLDELVQHDVPIVIQATRESEFALKVIPDNILSTGPIFLSSAPAAVQDPGLATWLAQKPTVLINLGSHTDYTENSSRAMIHAIRSVLDKTDLQFLWKYNLRHDDGQNHDYSRSEEPLRADLFEPLAKELASGRVKVVHWLTAEPSALLETGHIVASVHHGGANCFFEAFGNGIPHLILPVWGDTYDAAVRAEYLGVGVYGAKKSSPSWDRDELKESFLETLGNSKKLKSMSDKAKKFASDFKEPGRDAAARELARLARKAG